MITSKRVRVKGHYRVIERDEKGRIVSSKKWTNPKRNKEENYCPRCRHYTLEQKGTIDKGKMEVWHCSRCGYRSVRSSNKGEDK